MTGNLVVAMAGEVLAVGCVETSEGELFVTEVAVPSRVGGAAEAIGERSGEDNWGHDVVTRGDSCEEEARAFLGAGEETSLVLRREEAVELSETLFVLEARQLSLRQERITGEGERSRGRRFREGAEVVSAGGIGFGAVEI